MNEYVKSQVHGYCHRFNHLISNINRWHTYSVFVYFSGYNSSVRFKILMRQLFIIDKNRS